MITRAARGALEEALEDRIRFGVPLTKHTSLRIGGSSSSSSVGIFALIVRSTAPVNPC